MGNELRGLYFIKIGDGRWQDVTGISGVKVLKIDGFFDQGQPVNIYTAQWIDSQDEDFLITKTDDHDRPIVIRQNVDISITFIVGRRYASMDDNIDVATQHDAFVGALTNNDVWLRSAYTNKEVHCICLEKYTPTTVKLQRGRNSYIMGTITLHALSQPSVLTHALDID